MPALPDTLLPSEEDLLYEEEILRNPFGLKLWWRYLQARRDAPSRKRQLIFERALHALPGSYKLWHAYLQERQRAVRGLPVTHPAQAKLSNTYERALVTMHKMPRIWVEYLQHLMSLHAVTRARRTADRALRSLPVTQHDRIWALYLPFVRHPGVPTETALRVYRRFLKLEPTHVEEYIEFLVGSEQWQEAAMQLAKVLNDEEFTSLRGKSKHQLWLELCDLLTKHATEVTGLRADAIIRGGIRKFSDEVGRLWTSLADFYIRRALFEAARDVYEEGMGAVLTVRDFSIIFDAYTQFEESMLYARMEAPGGDADETGDWLHDEDDLDLRMARLEFLMERRPELLSSVLLRQNPHNVHEWHKRAKLFANNPTRQILTYTEAVRTVDPMQALGKPHTLWLSFARVYEEHGDVPNARIILERAVSARFKAVDDLADIWCAWAEMELRHRNFSGARDLLRRATSEPPPALRRQAGNEAQLGVHRSLKIWAMRTDLEESLGDVAAVRPLYDRILDLKIATPQIIINYALLLEEHKFFEDAFQVYERGVHIFKYPHVKLIWTAYLTKFVQRFGGKKLERARDLFEQALENVPKEECRTLYLQYARLEEEHGLARHAMAVYDRATKAVLDSEKMGVYELYIARAREFFGVPRTRDIYEQAIEAGLPDADVKVMCIKYAELERQLGEIDRARAIYVHASQLADPRADSAFWDAWNTFEIAHGNEDTFREMLRIKRSVSASYSQMHFIMPEYLLQKGTGAPAAPDGTRAVGKEDNMEALERDGAQSPAPTGRAPQFVSAGAAGNEGPPQPAVAAANPEEIELGEEEEGEAEGEEDEGDRVDLAQKEVPAAVYGALADKARLIEEENGSQKRQSEEQAEPIGALERMKRLRRE